MPPARQNSPIHRLAPPLPDNFWEWEQAGRGWQAFAQPVELEPVFKDLRFSSPATGRAADDGRIQGFWSRLMSGASKPLMERRIPADTSPVATSDKPVPAKAEPITVFRLVLPPEIKRDVDCASLLAHLAHTADFVGWEIIGQPREIIFQLVCPARARAGVAAQCRNQLPAVWLAEKGDLLAENFTAERAAPGNMLTVDCGLGSEWFVPLPASGKSFAPVETLLPLVAAFETLEAGETACLQILWARTRRAWGETAGQAIIDRDGKSRLANLQSVFPLVKDKLARPLFAVAIRLIVASGSPVRTREIVKATAPFFRQFVSVGSNELIPLTDNGLTAEQRLESLVRRQTYRSGMLLSAAELALFAHLPSEAVQSANLRREPDNTKAAPPLVVGHKLYLGDNTHRGKTVRVTLSAEQRLRHTFVVGGSGGGKSTLLLNIVLQSVEGDNDACIVVDPAGDLIDDIAARIPEKRIKDVIWFDPSDSEFPIAFNPLEAHSEAEKNLLSGDLTATLRRYSTAWGSLMEAAVANAVNAFLFNPRGGTLFDLKRFLSEPTFRRQILATCEDEAVRYFWESEAAGINAKSLSSVLIRLDGFLRHKLVRQIVCQKQSKLDFRQIIENRKILLVKLSQGLGLGEENAALLGTLILGKIYQTALARQDTAREERNPCWVVVDELQNFYTPSLSQILAGARKYGIAMTAATQSYRVVRNRHPDLAAALDSNCYSRLCFRLGDDDARSFANGFAFFNQQHLQNLGIGEAIARVERSDFDFNLKTVPATTVDKEAAARRIAAIIESSRQQYAAPLAESKAEILAARSETSNSQKSAETPPRDNESHSPTSAKAPQTSASVMNADQEAIQPLPSKHGGGGAHHREIQAVICRMGETYGFSAELEKSVAGGAGLIDVALERENLKIACEVSVTSTAQYELKNILKCLAAGFDYAIVVVSNRKKQKALATQIKQSVAPGQANQVKVCGLPELLAFLREQTTSQNGGSVMVKRRESKTGKRLNLAAAAEFLNVSASTLYRWTREGRVPFYRVGREYHFERDELVLIGRQDLRAKRQVTVALEPLKIEEPAKKDRKTQAARYRKLLKLD